MIKREKVLESIISGIEKARTDYEHWTGWHPDHAPSCYRVPEYMLTTYIAKSISGGDPGSEYWVTLESNVIDTVRDAGGFKPGKRSNALSRQGRFDIVLWSTNKPQAVIEVKMREWNRVAIHGIMPDVERISATLKSAKGIQYGVLALYLRRFNSTRGSAVDKLETVGSNIASHAKEIVESKGLRFKRTLGEMEVDDKQAFRTELLVITKKRNA